MANGLRHPRSAGGAAPAAAVLQPALTALNAGRPQDAERLARDVLKADPRDAQAIRILGYALLMQERAAEAVAALEPLVRGRHDAEIETQLAIALRQTGRDEEALGTLRRAVKRRPPFAGAFQELGVLLLSMGRYDEAVDVLSRGRDIAPMMPELSIQLGNALLQRKDPAQAKAAYARALDIAPGAYDALYGLAMAHRQLDENEAAAACFRRCLRSAPDDAGIWLQLGHCLLALGDRDGGYECFRAAARGEPRRYGTALASLAMASRGRFWLRPSAAARFLRGEKA